jgi:hypothetical protein
MKNRLLRYEEFRINESVSLLLEANIAFSEEFENLLDKMDTVVADKLLNMIGKDIDVNTNYIDVDIEKTDSSSSSPTTRQKSFLSSCRLSLHTTYSFPKTSD